MCQCTFKKDQTNDQPTFFLFCYAIALDQLRSSSCMQYAILTWPSRLGLVKPTWLFGADLVIPLSWYECRILLLAGWLVLYACFQKKKHHHFFFCVLCCVNHPGQASPSLRSPCTQQWMICFPLPPGSLHSSHSFLLVVFISFHCFCWHGLFACSRVPVIGHSAHTGL